jgi:hypothetical protein
LKKLNVYLAYFLLVAFAWVITPAHTIHDVFADHHDTADNFCKFYHSHLGTHVEEQHTHCDILKLDSPIYDLAIVVSVESAKTVINTSAPIYKQRFLLADLSYNLPSRAPPAI